MLWLVERRDYSLCVRNCILRFIYLFLRHPASDVSVILRSLIFYMSCALYKNFVWMIAPANRTAPFYGCLVAIFYCSPWTRQYVGLSYLDMKEFWEAFRWNPWGGAQNKKSDRNPELCTQKQINPNFSGLEDCKRRLRRISCCCHFIFFQINITWSVRVKSLVSKYSGRRLLKYFSRCPCNEG